jgi:hypothetical protein
VAIKVQHYTRITSEENRYGEYTSETMDIAITDLNAVRHDMSAATKRVLRWAIAISLVVHTALMWIEFGGNSIGFRAPTVTTTTNLKARIARATPTEEPAPSVARTAPTVPVQRSTEPNRSPVTTPPTSAAVTITAPSVIEPPSEVDPLPPIAMPLLTPAITPPTPQKPPEITPPARVEKQSPVALPQPAPLPEPIATPTPVTPSIAPPEPQPVKKETVEPIAPPALPVEAPKVVADNPTPPEPVKAAAEPPKAAPAAEPAKSAPVAPTEPAPAPPVAVPTPAPAAPVAPPAAAPVAAPTATPTLTQSAPNPATPSVPSAPAATASGVPSAASSSSSAPVVGSAAGAAGGARSTATVTLPGPRAGDGAPGAPADGATATDAGAKDGSALKPGFIDGFDPAAARRNAARDAARDLNTRRSGVPPSVAPSRSQREQDAQAIEDSVRPDCTTENAGGVNLLKIPFDLIGQITEKGCKIRTK